MLYFILLIDTVNLLNMLPYMKFIAYILHFPDIEKKYKLNNITYNWKCRVHFTSCC